MSGALRALGLQALRLNLQSALRSQHQPLRRNFADYAKPKVDTSLDHVFGDNSNKLAYNVCILQGSSHSDQLAHGEQNIFNDLQRAFGMCSSSLCRPAPSSFEPWSLLACSCSQCGLWFTTSTSTPASSKS
ncbi:hypothetical protein Vretimale_13782 [Volvox reticuliferus]|uniref:Uncharacterized protein n=1 Tax=Volvox reticuliferus TaxID=1737510 RepID=A0A8J4LUF2_9CHLO|nr:hypothetical protein Vretimale_13782 [Volvox reticuliferus]